MKKLFLILFSWFYLACQNSNQNLEIISPIENIKGTNVLDKISSLEYISLSNDFILDSDINKIVLSDSLLIFSTYNRMKIFFYNFHTKKEYRLQYDVEIPKKIGEDGDVLDITYDPESKTTYISDLGQNIFIIDNEHLKVTKLLRGNFGHAMTFSEGGLFLNNYSSDKRLHFLDIENNEIKSSYIKDDGVGTITIGANSFISLPKGKLAFMPTLFDTIYEISSIENPRVLFGIGNDQKSFRSIPNFQEYIKNVAFNPRQHKNDQLFIPKTPIYSVNDLIIINLLNNENQILYSLLNNKSAFVKRGTHRFFKLIFPYNYFSGINSNEEFIISHVMLDSEFYYQANNYLENGTNPIVTDAIKELLIKYPQGHFYENPVITKIKFTNKSDWF